MYKRQHLMAGHDDVLARVDQLPQHAFENVGVDGIQPAERLVQKDQLGIMDHGGDQLNLCLLYTSWPLRRRPCPRREARWGRVP